MNSIQVPTLPKKTPLSPVCMEKTNWQLFKIENGKFQTSRQAHGFELYKKFLELSKH